MDRRQRLRLIAALLVKSNHIFNRKIHLLLLKLLQNVRIITAVASGIVQSSAAVAYLAKRTPENQKIVHNGTFWEHDVPRMDNKKFKENFRLNKETFQKLCNKVRKIEKTNSNMKLCIPLEKRVAIALFALGSSAGYRTVSSLFGVGRSTAGEIVVDFCKAVCDNLADCINSYPPHAEEVERIVDGFAELGFPQCFGAVDSCHIAVQPKKNEAIKYCNSEGWHSVVLFASCDHHSKFTYTHIGSTGMHSDSSIFENSSLKQFHESADILRQNAEIIEGVSVPVLLIGDPAFGLSRYLMKPFPWSPKQPTIEKRFNDQLSRCHRAITNAFDQLKARFPIINVGLKVAPKNVSILIQACCILHNFLKAENDGIPDIWMQDATVIETAQSQPNHTTIAGEDDVTASAIRNAIALSYRKYKVSGVACSANRIFST